MSWGTLPFLNLSLETPARNVACDEALLLAAEQNGVGECLRVWESDVYFVAIGKNRPLSRDVNVSVCRADQVEMVRRGSGGGTVVNGPGCLSFALILSLDRAQPIRSVTASYEYILTPLTLSLSELTKSEIPEGSSDVVIGDRKIIGNAQSRKQQFILHHGCILYDFDLDRISRYLRMPDRQPDYRGGRPHSEFITNLGCTRSALVDCVRRAWGAEREIRDCPLDRVDDLVRQRFGTEEWTNRY